MTMKMFDLFYADLKNTVGSEQGGVRPVIVVQNNIGNHYSPGVIIIPMTSEIKKSQLPTHCIIHKSNINGLSSDSMILAEQVRIIDKSRLIKKLGHLDNEKDQAAVINAYMANITGKKTYDSMWTKIINMIFKLVKYCEGEQTCNLNL